MNKQRLIPLSLALLAALLLTGLALAASGPAVNWQVMAEGGAPSSGGNITLNDTLGQPIVGDSAGGNVSLGAGYWSGLGDDETKCGLAEGVTYAYNQTWPVSLTLENKGTIECLRVLRYDQTHPQRTGTSLTSGVGWGRYWNISATDSLSHPATGFTLTLSLPLNGETTPTACRNPGGLGGANWDCDDSTHTTVTVNTVMRRGITALSDWAVGNAVGPTAVTTSDLSATATPLRNEGPIGLALAAAVLIASVLAIVWRRQLSRA